MNSLRKLLPTDAVLCPSHCNSLMAAQSEARLLLPKYDSRNTVEACISLVIELEVNPAVPSVLRIDLIAKEDVVVRCWRLRVRCAPEAVIKAHLSGCELNQHKDPSS